MIKPEIREAKFRSLACNMKNLRCNQTHSRDQASASLDCGVICMEAIAETLNTDVASEKNKIWNQNLWEWVNLRKQEKLKSAVEKLERWK